MRKGRRPVKIPSHYYSRHYYLSPEARVRDFARFRKKNYLNRIYQRAISYLPKNIKGPFLDIGCGRGEIVLYLGRIGKKAYGIDYSKAAIEICKDSLKLEKKSVRSLVNFQINNCTRLNFKERFFECVFLLDVVEHVTITQLTKTLKGIYRVLKRGGILIIHTNNKHFERFTKLFVAASRQGLKVFFKAKQTLEQQASIDPYEYMHINYQSADQLTVCLKSFGFQCKVEYVKPGSQREIEKFVPFNQKWKRDLYYPIARVILNSPLVKFFAPTFWLIARKS